MPAKDKIRLNKFIAHSGLCSRRKADEFIKEGDIKVNGKVITELGYSVLLSDNVTYKGRKIFPEKSYYVLLNKPKDFITTTSDEKGRKTVMDLVRRASSARLYPVGRLDRNTTGILLLTNDGDLAQKLSHPSKKVIKVYQAELNKKLSVKDFESIMAGTELEDGPVKPDEIAFTDANNPRKVGIQIHSGRNRIVRRLFEYYGYEVRKLDRMSFAGLTKKNLPRGKWRYLSKEEIIRLKHFK